MKSRGLRVLYHRAISNYWARRFSEAVTIMDEIDAVSNSRRHAKRAIELSDKTLPDMEKNTKLIAYG